MSGTFRLDRYLARIGVVKAPPPTLAGLRVLHAAHTAAIPFEGLDPFVGRGVSLDLADLQAKLVESARGGYCFEQNMLFRAALEAMGFDVTGLAGRVQWMVPPDAPLGPRTHMLLTVALAEGMYLADVGFGACVLDEPLRLEVDTVQRTALGTFRLIRMGERYALQAMQPGGWRTGYVFDTEPQLPSDYELGNWMAATHPEKPFRTMIILERLARGRRHKLANLRYTAEARDGVVAEQRELGSAAELGEVLAGVFGIEPPVPAAALFERLADQSAGAVSGRSRSA